MKFFASSIHEYFLVLQTVMMDSLNANFNGDSIDRPLSIFIKYFVKKKFNSELFFKDWKSLVQSFWCCLNNLLPRHFLNQNIGLFNILFQVEFTFWHSKRLLWSSKLVNTFSTRCCSPGFSAMDSISVFSKKKFNCMYEIDENSVNVSNKLIYKQTVAR